LYLTSANGEEARYPLKNRGNDVSHYYTIQTFVTWLNESSYCSDVFTL